MGIQSLNNRGGNSIDVTKMIPISTDGSYVSASLGNYETLLNVTGRGRLDTAFIAPSGTTSLAKLKITIDGVVVFAAGGDASSANSGISVQSPSIGLSPTSSALYFRTPLTLSYAVLSSNQRNHPYTTDTARGFVILNSPLHFKSSLKIEIQSADATAVKYFYAGGSY